MRMSTSRAERRALHGNCVDALEEKPASAWGALASAPRSEWSVTLGNEWRDKWRARVLDRAGCWIAAWAAMQEVEQRDISWAVLLQQPAV